MGTMTDPGGVASAGTVGLDVVPNADGFYPALAAKVVPAADRAGQDAGKKLGDSIRTRLDTALKNLPKIDIDDNSTTVERNIANVRRQIEELRGKTIGVDISTDEFEAHAALVRTQINQIARDIEKLRAEGKDIPLDVDAIAAAAQIGRLRAEVADARREMERPITIPVVTDGAFAQKVKAAVDKASAEIHDIPVGVDTSGDDAKLAELKARLAELRSEKIGVDIDAKDVLPKIIAIKAELDKLGASSPNIQVKTDAAAASATLAALQAQVSTLSGQSVNISTGNSATEVFNLANAIAILGPAGVSAGAAAAGGILAIGSAATAAIAAIGVGKLALSGVSDAVKAIDAAQQGAGNSASSLAAQQTKAASSANAVRSAEASLANTRANAADSVRRADEQVGVAEQSLAADQRAALAVQNALSDARKEAARAMEDLNNQVADGALSQRRAVLDLADAQVAYNKVMADPTATLRQRQEAQLTFDEAKQHLIDINTQQKHISEDQTVSQQKGIEGSKQVIAAQDQIVQANKRVADAQRAEKDAELAAATARRQAAFSIAQAQQSVATAAAASGAATVAGMNSGSAATDKMNASLDSLSPKARTFALFLSSTMQPRLNQLKESAATGFLPGLQHGIETVLPTFTLLDTFVANTGTALGDMAVQAGRTFTNPFWRGFIQLIGTQAIPIMHEMFNATLNIAEGGARIIVAFHPVETELTDIFARLGLKFVAFSRGIDSNAGMQKFINFVVTETPHVLSAVGAIATAGGHLIQAYQPVGSVVVTEIKVLAEILSALPVGVVTALAFAFTAYRTATVLSDVATAGLNSKLVTSIASMVTYGSVTTAAGVTTTGMQRAVAGASSFLGGPFILAVSAAALVIGALVSQQQKAKQEQAALTATLADYGRTIRGGVTSANIDAARTQLENNKQLSGLVDTMQKAGVSSKTLADGLNGEVSARDKVIAGIEDQITLLTLENATADNKTHKANKEKIADLERLEKSFKDTNAGAAEANKLSENYAAEQVNVLTTMTRVKAVFGTTTADVNTYADSLDAVNSLTDDAAGKASILADIATQVGQSNVDAAGKAEIFGKVLADLGSAGDASGKVFDALGQTFNAIATSTLNAHDKVDLLTKALQQAYGPAQDLNEANEAAVRTHASLTTQLANNKAGFDLETASKGKNTTAILDNRDALEAALKAANETYIQEVANGTAEDVAKAKHDQTVASIEKGLPTRGKEAAAVQDIVSKYGQIPTQKVTSVSAPGLADAINQLVMAHAVQLGLDARPPWSGDAIQGEYEYLLHKINGDPSNALFHAYGGLIPGTAPNPRADNVLSWLTPGEYVHDVPTVEYYGVDAMRAIHNRQVPRQNLLPGYADGGLVDEWPVNINTSSFNLPDLASLWAQWNAAQTAAASSSNLGDLGIARTIYDVAQKLKADHKVLLSAYETALVESGLHNLLVATDKDSLGVFQQRPSQGWGTRAQVTDVGYAANAYLTRAIANEPRYATAGQLAQSVQRSAFPGRYDLHQGQAEAVIAAVTGGAGALAGAVGSAVAASLGAGLHFPPWPSSPAASRGDSGVWRSVIALINSTGPVSGVFGNSYRPGDPLWHGSGRAVDWMGYNQDKLATFLAGKRPLELIHRSNTRDYAFTRGVDKGSFNNDLMERHRNHVHIAMGYGGMVPLGTPASLGGYDAGGFLMPGITIARNDTGRPEPVLTGAQWDAIAAGDGQSTTNHTVNYSIYPQTTSLDAAQLAGITAAEDTRQRLRRPR